MINDIKTNYVSVTKRYADFDGRASRKEFWLYVLGNFTIQTVLSLGVIGIWYLTAINLSIITTVFALATLVPSLAVAVRRLHDTNRTGWWEMAGFVPVVGSLTLLVFYCLPGTADENKYGSPREIGCDPDVTPEQAERELEKMVDKLKEACVESLASEKLLERDLRKKMQELEEWEKRAAMAVAGDNDDLARQCLAKKLETKLAIEAFSAQLQTQKEASATMKEKFAEMQEQLRVFRMRKSNLEARTQSAASKETGNKTYSSGVNSAMDRFEESLRAKEAKAQASSEMARGTTATVDGFSDVEDELAAMKRSMEESNN